MQCLSFILKRITISEIKRHSWFLKNLPRELIQVENTNYKSLERDHSAQTVEEIMRIIQEARMPANASEGGGQFTVGMVDPDDVDTDMDTEEDSSYGCNECP